MLKLLQLLAVLLGMPVLALLTAAFTRSYNGPESVQFLNQGALVAGGLGLLLVGAIHGSEGLVKRNFAILWRLFAALLWLTLGTGLLLLAVHLGLMLYTIRSILPVLLRIQNGLLLTVTGAGTTVIGLILLGTAAGIFHLAWAFVRTFRRVRFRTSGRKMHAEECPALWTLVRTIAQGLSCQPPDQILLILQPEFFVTELPVWLGQERLVGRTLGLSLSVMHVLTEAELTAVIAHEMAHLGARDTLLLHRYAPILRRSEAIMRSLEASADARVFRSIALLPTVTILEYFHASFTRASSAHSRSREFRADAASLTLVPAAVMGAALVKVHAADEAWGEVMKQFFDGWRLPIENGALRFASLARRMATPERIAGLTTKAVAHPFDTHPSLQERLTALDLSLEAASTDLAWEPIDEAIRLVAHAEGLEAALTSDLREWVKWNWNDRWRWRG